MVSKANIVPFAKPRHTTEVYQFGLEPDQEVEKLKRIYDKLGTVGLTEDEEALLALNDPRAQLPDPFAPEAHMINLAEYLDDGTLGEIAKTLLDDIERDDASRADWYEREKDGIRMLGISKEVPDTADFEGASRVVFPMLAQACVEFNARAIAEMWPPNGPVKSVAFGENPSKDRELQASRHQNYMNFLYTDSSDGIPGAFEAEDQLLIRLPLSGSAFKKCYFDPVDEMIHAEFVPAEDLIVPYRSQSLETAARVTHRMRLVPNVVKQRMQSGYWRKISLIAPDEANTEDVVKDEIRQGVERLQDVSGTIHSSDERHVIYEAHVTLDLIAPQWVESVFGQGFDDRDRETGEPTTIQLPYIVTIDKEGHGNPNSVLAIRRNWRIDDPERKRKRIWFIHKKFTPGFGFYGFGILHWLGYLSSASTGVLRALLDAAQFSNLQGGYKSKQIPMKGGDHVLAPGEWREVDATVEDLAKGFFRLPYKEPSPTLFNLLGFLVEQGSKFISTTEAMVGESNQNIPVGTVLARIEQGEKVYSSIHKRLHEANKAEFKIVAELVAEYLPHQAYPYEEDPQVAWLLPQDFDARVDVKPVSDPQIVSRSQRILMAQALVERASAVPDLYDRREVELHYLNALRIPDAETMLLPQPNQETPPMDPVQEGMAMTQGRPVKAFPEQHHEAHLAVHQSWFGRLPPDVQKRLEGAYMAHQAEHLAWVWWGDVSQAMGQPVPADSQMGQPPQPPQAQEQYGLEVAARIGQLPPPGAGDMGIDVDEQVKVAKAAAEIERKDTEAVAKMNRDQVLVEAELRNKAIREALRSSEYRGRYES